MTKPKIFVLFFALFLTARCEELYETCDVELDGKDCMNYPYDTCQLSPENNAICQHK